MTKNQHLPFQRLALVAALLAGLASAGCASHPTNAQIGTGVGAVAGGAVGHVLFGGPVSTEWRLQTKIEVAPGIHAATSSTEPAIPPLWV